MKEELQKVDMLSWMFHNLNYQQIETLRNMARAMIEHPEPVTARKRPPLND